jgi:hypothetical protein
MANCNAQHPSDLDGPASELRSPFKKRLRQPTSYTLLHFCPKHPTDGSRQTASKRAAANTTMTSRVLVRLIPTNITRVDARQVRIMPIQANSPRCLGTGHRPNAAQHHPSCCVFPARWLTTSGCRLFRGAASLVISCTKRPSCAGATVRMMRVDRYDPIYIIISSVIDRSTNKG